MRKNIMLAAFCVVFMPTFGFAQSAQPKAEPAQQAPRRIAPPPPLLPAPTLVPFGVVRQDLFDRNDPNNLRSDYHGPPAQHGQF